MLERSEEIKSTMVDKYMASLNFFRGIYEDILVDEADDSYNALHRTVPILSKLLDDTSGEGKQLDLVIAEVENSTRDDFDVPEGQGVGEGDASHRASRTLMDIKGEMQKILAALKERFGDFIEACYGGLVKSAASVDRNDICAEIVRHYVKESCRSCGMHHPQIESATDAGDDITISVRDSGGRRFIVMIGPDMTFRGIHPADSSEYGSYSHYQNMFRPALSAVGHIRPVGENFIVLCRYPKSGPDDDGDIYDAYDVESNEPVVARVVMSGGKKTKSPSYSIVTEPIITKMASYGDRTETTVGDNAKKIMESPMVKINIPGSKYDGMAGTVDASRMMTRNDHVEFPVMLKYDTGLKTEVWVTDDDVVAYG